MSWVQEPAIMLCCAVEAIAPQFGCHVALTGGLLYKEGARKDCDLLFYRIRQVDKIDVAGLFRALAAIGIERITNSDVFCVKARHPFGGIDCFFPEVSSGDYGNEEDT